MKVVGAAEIIVWWDAWCLVSVGDAKSLWNLCGMFARVGGSGGATCLKPPHKLMIVVACCLGKRSFQLAITLKKNLKFTLGSTVTYLVSHFFTLFQTFPDWSKPPKYSK
jgi:hypothetical protein